MSHMQSHITTMSCHMYKVSCYTCERVLSRIWTSHVTHMNESCHTYKQQITHMDASWHTCECANSKIWMSHVSNMNGSCPEYECIVSHIWVLIIAWRYSQDEACHRYDWVMSQIWMSHVAHMNEACLEYDWFISQVCMGHMTGSRVTDMRWLRLVGFLKTYVSFAKEPYKKDYILQKKLISLRSLLIIATP